MGSNITVPRLTLGTAYAELELLRGMLSPLVSAANELDANECEQYWENLNRVAYQMTDHTDKTDTFLYPLTQRAFGIVRGVALLVQAVNDPSDMVSDAYNQLGEILEEVKCKMKK